MSASILKELFEKFINNTMTPEDVREFQAMVNDPGNRGTLDRLLEHAYRRDPAAIMSGGQEGAAGDIDTIFDSFMLKARQREPVPATGRIIPLYRRYRTAAMTAAILLLIAGMGLFFYHRSGSSRLAERTTISVRNGERKNLVLPDGTKVQLNAGSTLILMEGFNTEGRGVSLSGEAYFNVAKNGHLPFVIHTPSIDIKVLGTAFNVRAYPDEVNEIASLINGKILVRVKGKGQTAATDYYLSPLQKIIIQKDGSGADLSSAKPSDPIAQHSLQIDTLRVNQLIDQIPETAWTEDNLFFNAESLSDVIRKIERWYGVEVRLDNKEIENLHFTGNYRNQSLSAVMEALHIANPEVHYKIEKDGKLFILY